MAKKPTIDGIEIPSLLDDPDYRPAAALLSVLEDEARRVEATITRLGLEELLATKGATAKVDRIKHQIAEARRVEAKPPEPPAATGQVHPAVAKALALIRGEAGVLQDNVVRVKNLKATLEVFYRAIHAQGDVVDEIKRDKSHRIALSLVEANRSSIRNLYDRMVELSRTVDAHREFRSKITAAGYDYRYDLLPTPNCPSALALGSEKHFTSEISQIRRLLEDLKII